MIVGAIVLIGAALLCGSFVWGLIMYKFWYWFLLPVFPSLPHINYWGALGLVIFISLFQVTDVSRPIKEEYVDSTKGTVISLVQPFVILFIGWMIHSLFFN